MFNISIGAADVPAFLWYCNFQRPTLCCLKEGVWQESGKGHRASRDNNTPSIPRISITSSPLMLTLRTSIDQQQPTCCHCSGGSQSSMQPCMDIFSGSVGDGSASRLGPGPDLNLQGNVKWCTNSCQTLICDGKEHNENTAQRTEEINEECSLYTIWFLCACVLNWIGTSSDKEPNLLLSAKLIMSFHHIGLWFKNYNNSNNCALTAEHAKYV